MRKTFNEHIKRIKKLSMINEDMDLTANDNQGDPNDKIEDIINEPGFENDLEDALDKIVSDIDDQASIDDLADEVGDKDGKLEIEESLKKLDEAGLGMLIGGTALAAPKIAEMLGKGLSQIGKRVDSNIINNMGTKLSKAGEKLHHKYEGILISALKRLYPDQSDQFYKGAATAILLSATVALGISSISTAYSAATAGKAGLAALEGGLGGVKATEVIQAAKTFLPRVLSGLVK